MKFRENLEGKLTESQMRDVPNHVPDVLDVPDSKHKAKQVALTETEMKNGENQISGEKGEVYWYDFCLVCRRWRI